ncbi:hypothetical protein [Streptomyces sp. NPDC127112]|uniref:hypothetical protein n=1 Tax=unclassified Streptomyces TaxID=2593676 RepID=UPI00362597FA
MGLGIYARDARREKICFASDDPQDSFYQLCAAAPWESLRRGVMKHGETVFNSVQLRRLIEELEALPPGESTPVVRDVVEAARLAIRRSGYLQFIGD